tara:strand:- start:505 stop:1119 length:615 start_codon:yes stop_codon:yes gene_type:complete
MTILIPRDIRQALTEASVIDIHEEGRCEYACVRLPEGVSAVLTCTSQSGSPKSLDSACEVVLFKMENSRPSILWSYRFESTRDGVKMMKLLSDCCDWLDDRPDLMTRVHDLITHVFETQLPGSTFEADVDGPFRTWAGVDRYTMIHTVRDDELSMEVMLFLINEYKQILKTFGLADLRPNIGVESVDAEDTTTGCYITFTCNYC